MLVPSAYYDDEHQRERSAVQAVAVDSIDSGFSTGSYACEYSLKIALVS